MLKTNYRSYTVHGSTTYSDGMRTGLPNFTPNLAKCPNCAAVFFLHNLWAKREDVPYEERQFWKDIADPSLEDYIKAVEQGLAKTEDEEIEARTCLWKALNNITRNGGTFSSDTMKLWEENCERLLFLKEQKLNRIMETAELDVMNNLRIEVAELQRNLGLFDKCLQTIESFPDSYDFLKRQFTVKCRLKDRMVFKVRYKNENPDGNDCFIDEDGEYRHFLDPGAKNADFGKILDYWTKQIEENADASDIDRQRRAYVYYKKGDYESALSDINRAIELNGDYEDAFRLRAKICRALGSDEMEAWNTFRARHIETFDKMTQNTSGKTKPYRKMNDDFDYYALEKEDGKADKPLILIEEFYDILQNSAGDIMFCIRTRDGEPVQPEILYSGGVNALYRRRPDQFILLDEVHPDVREALRNAQEVLIAEFNPDDRGDKRELPQMQTDPESGAVVYSVENKGGILREYMAKLRPVFETLDSVKSIVEDGYPLFTSRRARVYANADRPIMEVIGKEDYANLIAVLAREEDYEQLDRFFAECPVKAENYERLADYMKDHPVNQWVSCLFRAYKPTPLFYITTKNVISLLKEPVKILRYLTRNGADPDKESGEGDTPLGNQCYATGNTEVMRNLLEAGANPELTAIVFDEAPIKPMLLVLYPSEYDPETHTFTPITADDAERVKLLIANGADVNTVWEWESGITPLSLAIAYARGEQQRELVNLLRNRGADVDAALKGLENNACEQRPEYYYALYEFYAGFPNQGEPMPGMTTWVNHETAKYYLALAAKAGYQPAIERNEERRNK
jgi:tetratricopeptide (TPR) repeat protein